MKIPAAAPPARRRLPALAALLVPVLLSGCSGRPAPVAKVGGDFITVDQFQDAARGNEAQYPGVPDSAKVALLEDLTRRSLLIQEARRRRLVSDSTLERVRKQEGERLAVEQL